MNLPRVYNCLCYINLASERVGVGGAKMDDKFTLKEIVTMYFWVKDKNFG